MTDIAASEFLARLRVRLADAMNESEIRQRFVEEIYATYGTTLRLERGRTDAQLDRVILEFKDKGLFRSSTTSTKFQEAYIQLTKKYIPAQANIDNLPLFMYTGIVIDGVHFAFVFFEENGTSRHTALLKIDENSIPLLLDAILKDKRRAFSLENLLEDFGSQSYSARQVLVELWAHLEKSLDEDTGSPKVRMLFQEWSRIFAQVTNLGRVGRSRIDGYLLELGMARPLDYTRALFTLHTYNALLIKLIAGELVTTLRFERYSGFASQAAGSPLHVFKDLLNNRIEQAEIFVNNGIENFIEGTFFSWYLERCPDTLLIALRQMLARLGMYIFPTVTHQHIRDVIKAFYQSLVPEALRKNIGEFYTPEWLVEFTLDEAGFRDSEVLEKRILDPCCGSGNFLIHAIARIKTVARTHNESNDITLRRILNNVIGFDLNPLAVLSARLNYLLAISDVLSQSGRIEIPVYLSDAVYAPTELDNKGTNTRTYNVGTVLGNIELELPENLVQNRDAFGKVLSAMERNIEAHATRDDFLADLSGFEGDTKTLVETDYIFAELLGRMFDQISELERKNWNRIWCRIIRDHFASVAVGTVDIIAGNPPWVRWSELPEEYRERIKPTCSRYTIFSNTPFFGGNELDISGMIAYTTTDKWLKQGGVLAFIITQIHFQAPSSEGFRYFSLPDGTKLGVKHVHDFTDVRPFPGVANKPAVFTWVKGDETQYPVPYTRWRRESRVTINEHNDLEIVKPLLRHEDLVAIPIPPDSRWSILNKSDVGITKKLQGGSNDYIGRKGITADLNGVYFVELLGPGSRSGLVKIRTTPQSGRKSIPLLDQDVNADLVFPLLKSGEQIRRFSYHPHPLVAIVPNKVITSIPTTESFMKESLATYRYFSRINKETDEEGNPLLESRSTWRTRMKPADAPFYAVYNVGPYTFAPYKVAWAEMAGSIAAAVVSEQEMPFNLGKKPVVPDHKIYFVSCDNEEEAHYLCALLNSALIRNFVDSFTVKLQVGTIFRHLNIPLFDKNNLLHVKLSALSIKAHNEGISEDIQQQIDDVGRQVIDEL